MFAHIKAVNGLSSPKVMHGYIAMKNKKNEHSLSTAVVHCRTNDEPDVSVRLASVNHAFHR